MLRQRHMQMTVVGNTQLVLEAEADESYRIRGIHVNGGASAHIQARVNRTIVGDIRQSGVTGSHCYFPTHTLHKQSLYNWLIEEGIFSPIPVPSGMRFFIDNAHDSNSIVTVTYDKYDADDVSPNETNGVDSNEYDLIQYGQTGTITAAGEQLYVTQVTDNSYPAFPFDRVVPANHQVTWKGIAFSSFNKTDNSDTDEMESTFLRFVKDRKTLFDQDLQGLIYRGVNSNTDNQTYGNGQQAGGQRSSVDISDPLIFEEPIVFGEGEDMDVFLNLVLSGGSVNVDPIDTELALIFSVKRGV